VPSTVRCDHTLAQCVPEFRSAERGINAGYTKEKTTTFLPQAGA
jgi:hypothetical protein